MNKVDRTADSGYTREELVVLAQIRRQSGRTCKDCQWSSDRGKHKGCFPDGKYRKWLSPDEFVAGCDSFLKRESKG